MSKHYIGMPARGPKTHQWIGQVLATNLNTVLDMDELVAIHEANLYDGDADSKAPDVTIFKTEDWEPVVVFEVALKGSTKATIRKCRQILEESGGTIEEAFILEYEPVSAEPLKYTILSWYKLTPDGAHESDATFSDYLDMEVDDLAM